MSFLEPGCRFAEPLEAFGCDVRSLPSAGACHSSGKMENPFPGLLHPSRSAQVQEDPLSSAQLFTVGTRQLLRGHLGLHLFPSSTDKGPLPSQTGASMFPAHCLKQYFSLASSWQWVVCYMEKWLPGVRSCLGGESPFPWHSVVTPYTPQSPGRCSHSKWVPRPPNHPLHSEGSWPSQGLQPAFLGHAASRWSYENTQWRFLLLDPIGFFHPAHYPGNSRLYLRGVTVIIWNSLLAHSKCKLM